MYKLLVYSILFLISSVSFAQTPIAFTDTDLTSYDILFLEKLIEDQKDTVLLLHQELNSLQVQFNTLNNDLSKIIYSLNLYKDLYSSVLVSFYKIRSTSSSTFIFLFSSKSFNQLFVRYNYLKILTKYLNNLTNYIILLTDQYSLLLRSVSNNKKLLNSCLLNYQNKKTLLDSNTNLLVLQGHYLQQNSDSLRIDINKQFKDFDTVKNYILNNPVLSINDTLDEYFEVNVSPLSNSIVISSFGVHSHSTVQRVQVKNDGIDLFSSTDTVVNCVFNGIVIAIIDIPNSGKSVVIQHNNYYTVYSNLNLVYVNVNNTVFSNQLIGTISKTTSKYSFPCLNFQIWNGQQKLNPATFYDF